jgi:signal transduction histidine kinase
MQGVARPQLGHLAVRLTSAVVVALAAFLLRQVLTRRFGIGLPPFVTLYPAVVIVALRLGLWAGLVATASSALLAFFWVFPSSGQWTIRSTTEAIYLVVFCCLGALTSIAIDLYRRNLGRITDLEKERALRENERRFRAFVTASTDVVYRMSPDWSEMRNLQGREFSLETGVPTETWVQKYIYPDDRPLVMAAIDKAIRTRDTFESEHRVLLADGSLRWTFSRAVPLKDADGEIVEWFGAASDITDRKRAEDELRRSEDRLRALAARLQTAGERERLRIARELHDQMGSALTGIKMDLDWIVQKHGAGAHEWVPMVEESMKSVDSAIGLVRRLATELRPQMLDTVGLGAAIECYAAQFQQRTGISCAVKVSEDRLAISSDQSIALFRIFQEALTNVSRHSQATKVAITLVPEQSHAILTIEDDGVGFPAEMLAHRQALGVLGMRERALLLGAEFSIESGHTGGTTITLRMPLEYASETPQVDHEYIDC